MVSVVLAIAIVFTVFIYIFFKAIFMEAKYDKEDLVFVLMGITIAFILIKERE